MTGPSMTLEQAQELAARARYPKVSKESIEAKIQQVAYMVPEDCMNLTICIITMKNGFFVIGKAAPVDPRNFDPEIGARYAYEDAFKQLWMLEGYLLKESVYAQTKADQKAREDFKHDP